MAMRVISPPALCGLRVAVVRFSRHGVDVIGTDSSDARSRWPLIAVGFVACVQGALCSHFDWSSTPELISVLGVSMPAMFVAIQVAIALESLRGGDRSAPEREPHSLRPRAYLIWTLWTVWFGAVWPIVASDQVWP